MTRIREIPVEEMTPEQRQVHDDIVNGPRGRLEAPHKPWMYSPVLADTGQKLGAFVRYNTTLGPRLSELAILITGRFWTAQYEWYAHKPFALEAGLSIDVINAIRDRQPPPFENEDEKVVYDFCMSVHRDHVAPEPIYKAAVDAIGERGVVDLIGLLGYYTLVSMTLNVFELPVPDGEVEELK